MCVYIYIYIYIYIIHIVQQTKTYPHPRIPAARLFFVILFFLCVLPPGEIQKSGVGITFWVPRSSSARLAALGAPGGLLGSNQRGTTCRTLLV